MKTREKRLEKLIDNCSVICLETVDSTNSEARRKILDGHPMPLLIVADRQTAGKGRMGRHFDSDTGGLYMSVAFKTENLQNAVSVTAAAAAAVVKSLEDAGVGGLGIKWVNDIIRNGKKICGILAEAISGASQDESYIIVGIGINCGKGKFSSELESIAGCVDISCSREALAASITKRLLEYSVQPDEQPRNKEYMDIYREHFLLYGVNVRAIHGGESVCGLVVDVDDDGGLLLLRDGDISPTKIFSGEVTIRPVSD